MSTNNQSLPQLTDYGKINTKRRAEIFLEIARHATALIYLIGELIIGVKPNKL